MRIAQVHKKILVSIFIGVSLAGVLYAFAFGPYAHYTGVPTTGETTCVFCHSDTPLNGGGGKVSIAFPNGLSYSPGQKQTLTVTITDSAASVYGFQMTARLISDLAGGQAGTFTPGSQQEVLCSSTDTKDRGSMRSGAACSATEPLEFVEQSSPLTTSTFSVDWTPPVVPSGQVAIYISANAANGDRRATGDHIYNTGYTLSPAAGDSVPKITGIGSASAFNQKAGLASGTWLEIYGENLSTTSEEWEGSDFHGDAAPTSLNGVSVTINGLLAFVRFVSPGQVNVQAPDDPAIGDGIPVRLSNSAGTSAAVNMHKSALAPALLAPPSFNVNGKQYVGAVFANGRFVGDPNILSGAERPAQPGDVIVIYAIGCGPVTPESPAGTITAQANHLQNKAAILFGQTPAKLSYSGLTPGFVGLYQFNVKVPNVSDGDVPLTVTLGGNPIIQNVFITIRK